LDLELFVVVFLLDLELFVVVFVFLFDLELFVVVFVFHFIIILSSLDIVVNCTDLKTIYQC
jgi:hypothetical protein